MLYRGVMFFRGTLSNASRGEYVERPAVIKLFIGGAFGPSYEIFSDGFTLRYKHADDMFTLIRARGVQLRPDLAAWKEFMEELDRLNVLDWRKKYTDSSIQDGTSWSVIIADASGRTVTCSGSNAYPEKFNEFLAAVNRLIGGKEFH